MLYGNNIAADFYDALNEEGEELLADAAHQAEANDRKAVHPGISDRAVLIHV